MAPITTTSFEIAMTLVGSLTNFPKYGRRKEDARSFQDHLGCENNRSTTNLVDLTTMDDRSAKCKSVHNNCSCTDCVSVNCITCHRRASCCTCDRCENYETCLAYKRNITSVASKDKLKQIYDASQLYDKRGDPSNHDYDIKNNSEKWKLDSNILKNTERHKTYIANETTDKSIAEELNVVQLGALDEMFVRMESRDLREEPNDRPEHDKEYKPFLSCKEDVPIIESTDAVNKRGKKHIDKLFSHTNYHKSNKTLQNSKDFQVPRNKIHPSYCPTCHKISIEEHNEEHNEEHFLNKTIMMLKECPQCRKAFPMTQKISEYKTPFPITSSDFKEFKKYYQPKKNRHFPKSCENSREMKTCPSNITRKQTKDKIPQTISGNYISPELKTNVMTDMKGYSYTNTKIKAVASKGNKIVLSAKCSDSKETKKYTKKDKIYSKSFESLCPSPGQKQDHMKAHKKSSAGYISIFTQTDDLPLEQNSDIMTLIKECVHKELKNFHNILPNILNNANTNTETENYEYRKIYSQIIPMHKTCDKHNINPTIYDRMKNFIKEIFSGPNESITSVIETQTSSEIQQFINQTNTTLDLINYEPSESLNIHTVEPSEIELKVPQLPEDTIRRQHSTVLEFEDYLTNERKTTKLKESKIAVNSFKTPSSHKYKTPAGELRAEIMNVPYTKYKQTVNHPESKPKYTNENILYTINKIYKACSCKVCECISMSPTTIEGKVCSCKPCDCVECSSQRENCNNVVFTKRTNNTKILDSNKCACEKCNCIKCMEEPLQKMCDCMPCECIKCNNLKSMQMHKRMNYIVAPVTPVEERQQRPYCQCSPCGCFECAHPFGTIAPTHYTQETATDVRRHMNCSCNHCENDQCEQEGTDTCSCDRHSKLMRKPVTHNKDEYDIHYCINKHSNTKNYEYLYNKKRNPVTIYTSLTHRLYYPRVRTYTDNTHSSLKFNTKSNNLSRMSARIMNASIIPQEYWTLRSYAHLKSNSINECDCKPCECHKCREHFLEGHIPYRQGNCLCEICDCINCATLSVSYKMKNEYNKRPDLSETYPECNCLPCNCKYCSKYTNMINNYKYDNLNGITIASPKEKINRDNILSLVKASDSERFIDHVLSNKESKNPALINKSIISKQISFLCDQDNLMLHCANMQKNEGGVYCNRCVCIESRVTNAVDTYCIDYNNSLQQHNPRLKNLIQNHEGKEIYNTKDNSQISNHSERINSTISSSTKSSLGYLHMNDPVRKEPKMQKAITRSSCNSSGYDYSDYLIHFPTSTVQTCINDVMSLLYNKHDEAYLKLSRTSKPVKDYSESSIKTLQYYHKDLHIPGLQSFETLQQRDYTGTKCKRGNSDQLCDCTPCDCDKCSYEMPKLKRCRCDCATCRCDGTCLSEDRSVLIRKNEITQTTKSAPGCGVEITKELPALKLKKSNVTFSNNDKIVKLTNLPMTKLTYNTINNTIMPDLPKVNCDSVQRTINEARQFSLQLFGILQKYEKANKDFDTMCQRYKTLNKSTLCEEVDQSSKQPNNYQIAYIKALPEFKNNTCIEKAKIKVKEDNLQSSELRKNLKSDENLTFTELYTSTSETDEQNLLQENDIERDEQIILKEKDIKTNEQNFLQENYMKTDEQTILKEKGIKTAELKKDMKIDERNILQEYYKTYEQTILKEINKTDEHIVLIDKDMKIYERNILEDNDIKRDEHTIFEEKEASISSLESCKCSDQDIILQGLNPTKQIQSVFEKNEDDHTQTKLINEISSATSSAGKSYLEKLKSEYKKYSLHINEVINKRRQTVWKNERTDSMDDIRVKDNTVTANKYSTKSSGFSYSIPPIKNFLKNKNSGDLNTVFICQSQKFHEPHPKNEIWPKILNIEQLDSLKKIIVPDEKETDVAGILKADLLRYCPTRDVQSQTRITGNSTPSIAKSRIELSSNGIKSAVETHMISNLDPLKVVFQMIRKVSEHSILLKWKIPGDISNIEGYEVQVDGQSIQRILNPIKNMAVLTCLPHADKVQLTVRTITKTAVGHSPSATISYCLHGFSHL